MYNRGTPVLAVVLAASLLLPCALAGEGEAPEMDPRVAEFVKKFDSPDANVRLAALKSLHRHRKIARPAVPHLIKLALEDKNLDVRTYAAWVLKTMRCKDEVLPVFIKELKHPDARRRLHAVLAIYQLDAKDKATATALAPLLDDEATHVRTNAAATLLGMGPGLRPTLDAIIKKMNAPEEKAALKALKTLDTLYTYPGVGPPPAPPTETMARAIKFLHHKAPAVRRTAVHYLSSFDNEATHLVPRIVDILINEEEDAGVRFSALGFLAVIPAREHPEAVKKAMPRILAVLKNGNHPAQETAAMALTGCGPAAVEAMPLLMAKIKREDCYRLRGNCLMALGGIGPEAKKAIPLITLKAEKAGGEGVFVREGAMMGLLRIEPTREKTIALLLRHIVARDDARGQKAARAALTERSGPHCLPTLVKGLENESEKVRRFSAQTLGKLGKKAKKAGPALQKALKDKSTKVSNAAAKAIDKIGWEPPQEEEEVF